MRTFFKTCFCLALPLVLLACTPNEPLGTTIPTAEPVRATATSMDTTLIPATMVASLPTLTALPTVSFDMTPVVGSPTLPSLISPTPQPYFAPAEIPGLLQAALSVETLSGFNGHELRRISGWRWGFKSLEWMDADHLLFYPAAGTYSVGGGIAGSGIHPAVASLASSTFWIPLPYRSGGEYYPALPRWSARLDALVAAASDASVAVYSPDGQVRKVYEGKFLGISPSATRLLIDDTWIDLGSGKTVDFGWRQTDMAAEYSAYAHSHQADPVWSPDEMRVYNCCYMYGDARTGASLVMPYNGVTIDGQKTRGSFEVFGGTWVLNDKYVLPVWEGAWDGRYSAVYLLDPAAKTFRDLSALAGVPYQGGGGDPSCNRPSAQKGGRYVWVDCVDGGHLIDLVTFHSQAYPPFDRPYGENTFAMPDAAWSADGNFVLFNQEKARGILSAATGEMKPLPRNCSGFQWHPKDNALLCMADDGRKLLILDAGTLSVLKETTLPARLFMKGWSPDGKHMALLAGDNNSLWRIDYPGLDNLEQLTSTMPQLLDLTYSDRHMKNLAWSTDGTALAFIAGEDIYIVDVGDTP